MAGGQQPQENDVPVYLFTGFLEAGKTKFIQETLEDKRFNSGEKTMLLLCEEGEEEYDISAMPCQDIYIRTIEEPEELNPAHLEELLKAVPESPGRLGGIPGNVLCGCDHIPTV